MLKDINLLYDQSFLDASQAFDRVQHFQLFCVLTDHKMSLLLQEL